MIKLYHPKIFKEADTVVLKKLEKSDYILPKIYRPMALLITLGKVLESLLNSRLSRITEIYDLLPQEQMGARKVRSTKTVLELLIKQVYTIQGRSGENLANLLCLDVTGAFHKVLYNRLLHNLRMRRIPAYLTGWVTSFLKDRKTTILIKRRKSRSYEVIYGIPQGSPVSPILFLSFNAELFDRYRITSIQASTIGFVDNINILAHSNSIEKNNRILDRLHDIYL